MRQKIEPDETQQLEAFLNDFIKRSHYINSLLDSQRMASAQAIAIVINALAKHDPSLGPVLLEAVSEIELQTFTSPSIDGDRSLIARAIRAELLRASNAPGKSAPHSSIPAQSHISNRTHKKGRADSDQG